MSFNHCVECGNTLSIKAKSCSCGWRRHEESAKKVVDHGCHFRAFNRRCPLYGGISPDRQGDWYCSEHWRCLGDPKKGEAVLIEVENNYQKYLECRSEWRRSLFS